MLYYTVEIYGRDMGMITGELKNKVDALWNIFWTGGITNPLDVVE